MKPVCVGRRLKRSRITRHARIRLPGGNPGVLELGDCALEGPDGGAGEVLGGGGNWASMRGKLQRSLVMPANR